MKKIFFDHGRIGATHQVCGWEVASSMVPLPILGETFVPPAGEVTVVVSHHIFGRTERAHLSLLAQRAVALGGAFFFVYVSRGDPAALNGRQKPEDGIFVCHSEALPAPDDCTTLLEGNASSKLGVAVAAINAIAPHASVAQQAQEVRRILDKINGTVGDNENFYSAVSMLLVRKALEVRPTAPNLAFALESWISGRSNSGDTVAQLEEKVLKRFRPAGE